MDEYKLVFNGKLVNGYSVDQAKVALREKLKLSSQMVELLFSSKNKKIIIKKTTDLDRANHYCLVYEKAGILLDLIKSEELLELNPNELGSSLALEPIDAPQESKLLNNEPSVIDDTEKNPVLHNIFQSLKAIFPLRVWLILVGLTFLYLYSPTSDIFFKKGFALGCILIIFANITKSRHYRI